MHLEQLACLAVAASVLLPLAVYLVKFGYTKIMRPGYGYASEDALRVAISTFFIVMLACLGVFMLAAGVGVQ